MGSKAYCFIWEITGLFWALFTEVILLKFYLITLLASRIEMYILLKIIQDLIHMFINNVL